MMNLRDTIGPLIKHEGPAAIVTSSPEGPHLVGTWNSYLELVDDRRLAVPAGGLSETERNVQQGSKVQMLIGSKEVRGMQGPGAGFRLSGQADFQVSGEVFRQVKSRFDWARAAMVLDVEQLEQLT